MNSNANAKIDRFDITRCSICSKAYCSPRQLPCVHTFCLPCLERHGINKRPGDVVHCPLCGDQFKLSTQGFVGLPRNIFIEEQAEVDKLVMQAMNDTQCDRCFELFTTGVSADVTNGDGDVDTSRGLATTAASSHVIPPAAVHCNGCIRNLCSKCCQLTACDHQSVCDEQGDDGCDAKSSSHNVVDINKHLRRLYQRHVTYCDVHPDEAVGLYCYECRTTLCTICNIDGSHRIHRCTSVERAAAEFEHQFERDATNISERYRTCVQLVEAVESEKRSFVSQMRQVESEVRQKAEEMKKLVDRHVAKLLDELNAIGQQTISKLDNARTELDRFLSTSDSFIRYTEAIRNRGTSLDISRSGHDLVSRAAALQTLPFVPNGKHYRTPLIQFRPWYDLIDLLEGNDENVIGSISTAAKDNDGSPVTSYCLKPSPVNTLHEDAKAVLGIATLSSHVIVVRVESSELELYSAVTWSLQRRIAVPGLCSPTDVVACPSLKRVFVSDWTQYRVHYIDLVQTDLDPLADKGQSDVVEKAVNGCGQKASRGLLDDESSVGEDGESVTSWPVGDKPWSLSLSSTADNNTSNTATTTSNNNSSILVTCDQTSRLKQFTLHGSLLRQINLSRELVNPRHAIQLSSGQFLVSFSDCIRIIGTDGKQMLSDKSSSSSGFNNNQTNVSGRLAMDNQGHVMLLDVDRKRVILFTADEKLKFIREIVPHNSQLRYAARLCLDSQRGRIYIADNELSSRPTLKMGSKFWGKTGRVLVYETKPTT